MMMKLIMMVMMKYRGSETEERVQENVARSGGEEEVCSTDHQQHAPGIHEPSRPKHGTSSQHTAL